jgi:uncharacterized protein YdaU (DUF1376 family)
VKFSDTPLKEHHERCKEEKRSRTESEPKQKKCNKRGGKKSTRERREGGDKGEEKTSERMLKMNEERVSRLEPLMRPFHSKNSSGATKAHPNYVKSVELAIINYIT